MAISHYPPELSVALAAAREAGQAIRRYYRNAYEVKDKSPDNPITDADREADRILRERITAAFPQDGWLSEETRDDPTRLSRKRVWIVDPLDGTKDFIGGIPEFALSIALWA
ncbi:MAG: 3'(2'),5'-bisphosphate nucleotidase CysQ, partial [Chloroflexi bacterium]